jgi:hypothetical protein
LVQRRDGFVPPPEPVNLESDGFLFQAKDDTAHLFILLTSGSNHRCKAANSGIQLIRAAIDICIAG